MNYKILLRQPHGFDYAHHERPLALSEAKRNRMGATAKKILLSLSFMLMSFQLQAARVALAAVATGRYDVYAYEMIESARTYFCKDHDVHYFIFTDSEIKPELDDVTQVFQKRLGWPYDTLMRFAIYLQHKDLFDTYDYIYAIDADMLFVAPVGSEIFAERVVTQHPGYTQNRGTYETNPISTAYVAPHEGTYYVAGGFYGGEREPFFAMLRTLVNQIETDLNKNYIAVWHDESHLNRYCIDNPPAKILSPSYCYPQNAQNYPAIRHLKRKLVAIDKNHQEVRK